MEAINWTNISTPNMHGIEASIGTRTAQVIKAYEGEWLAYCTLDGHICKRAQGEPQYESYQAARRRATDFLLERVTPDVWPCGCCGA